MTLVYMTRYAGSTRGRILQGSNRNWLVGHWGGRAGVAHHEGWLGGHPNMPGPTDDWVLGISRSRSAWFYKSGQDRRAVTGGDDNIPERIMVNMGAAGGERSDWEIAEVAMFKQRLSDVQCERLAGYYIDKFGSCPRA